MLTELEQDAHLLATAAAEGMTGGEPSNLREVLDAKEALERAGAAQASTAPGNPPPGSDKEIAQEIDMEKLDP